MWIPSDPNQIRQLASQFVAQLDPSARMKVGIFAQAILDAVNGGSGAAGGQAAAAPPSAASPDWLLNLIQQFMPFAPPPR